ncbi:MAG: hypothetical protein LUE93_00855 [Bacteroides sp.]|nr:hypothetical protein [Bacteroides sp.]
MKKILYIAGLCLLPAFYACDETLDIDSDSEITIPIKSWKPKSRYMQP